MAILQVIKYEGDNTTFVWKHPCEDFNTGSQLIVHESQEAIFFLNGQALDIFGPGRYTLETQNIPLLRAITNIPTGGNTAFHCEVYFINKTEQMAVKWGTDSKVQFMEPVYHFPIEIGASGEMSLKVNDSKKLLLKLVGTENGFTRDYLVLYFRAFLMTKIKPYIAKTIREKQISIFEIDEHLNDISTTLHSMLLPDFDDYGISLERFFVTIVVKPDGEASYEKFKTLHFRQYADITEAKIRQQVGIIDAQTQAQKTVIESQAIAKKRSQEGYTYGQERGFDVAKAVAENEAAGQFTNMGIGLGAMAGVGGTVGGMVGNAVKGAVLNSENTNLPLSAEDMTCPKCGAPVGSDTNFCPKCGEKIVHAAETVVCPQCGKKIPKCRFCPECGYKFADTCPKCGTFTNGAKFCPNCGEKLF